VLGGVHRCEVCLVVCGLCHLTSPIGRHGPKLPSSIMQVIKTLSNCIIDTS
jgi:hypothetical protein